MMKKGDANKPPPNATPPTGATGQAQGSDEDALGERHDTRGVRACSVAPKCERHKGKWFIVLNANRGGYSEIASSRTCHFANPLLYRHSLCCQVHRRMAERQTNFVRSETRRD